MRIPNDTAPVPTKDLPPAALYSPETVTVPKEMTGRMIQAVRDHPETSVEDRDEWHTRLGWLICAWGVLLDTATKP